MVSGEGSELLDVPFAPLIVASCTCSGENAKNALACLHLLLRLIRTHIVVVYRTKPYRQYTFLLHRGLRGFLPPQLTRRSAPRANGMSREASHVSKAMQNLRGSGASAKISEGLTRVPSGNLKTSPCSIFDNSCRRRQSAGQQSEIVVSCSETLHQHSQGWARK